MEIEEDPMSVMVETSHVPGPVLQPEKVCLFCNRHTLWDQSLIPAQTVPANLIAFQGEIGGVRQFTSSQSHNDSLMRSGTLCLLKGLPLVGESPRSLRNRA